MKNVFVCFLFSQILSIGNAQTIWSIGQKDSSAAEGDKANEKWGVHNEK